MAKYFHRLPNGDFQMFDSYDEYLQELKRTESYPIIMMMVVGVLFIVGAIWKWDAADPVGNFALLGSGIWTIFFTVWAFLAGCNRGTLFGIIMLIIGMIPMLLVLGLIFGQGEWIIKGIIWLRSLFS